MVRRLLAILVVSATCAIAHAQSGSSVDPTFDDNKKLPVEEEPVAPTGLIIAGVALAAFAILLLVGRRKKGTETQAAENDLAEVRLIIESEERATVWTKPSLKLQTDRLGEVVLHLPIGRHDVNIQIGSETFTRSVQVDAIKRMRVPINFVKERIARTKSADFPPVAPAGDSRLKPEVQALVADLPLPQPKAPTSAARAYPDAASQSKLGAQLANLIDVELDSPAKDVTPPPAKPLDLGLDPGASGDIGGIDFSPLAEKTAAAKSPPPPSGLTLDLGTEPGSEDFDVPLTPPPVAVPVPATNLPLPPSPPRPSPLRDAEAAPQSPARTSPLAGIPSRSRPPTSPLDGIIKESGQPTPERAPLLPKGPPPARANPLDELSLDDIAPPKPVAAKPAAAKVASLGLDDLDDLAPSQAATAPPAAAAPITSPFELAPPERTAAAPASAKASLPSVSDFALDDLVPARPAPEAQPMPKVTASSVNDLTLDEEDLAIQRIPVPTRTKSKNKVASVSDFTLDDSALELPTGPAPQIAPRAAPMPRPVTPIATTSSLDDILAPAAPAGSGARPAVDRYRRTTALGPGPLGTLHRARDEQAGRDVLIEEVGRDVTLVAPTTALTALTHANIVKLHDHDAAKGYLVYELVEGKSLKQLLAERGTFASLEAIGIVDQVCAALAAAHDKAIFHRGVRPACILVSGRTVKLFGFATNPAARSLPYTAPEIAAGNPPDARSDLYSVGVVLAELLTGAVPVPGKLEFPADVPRPLASLVRKLLSREPTIRPATAKAVRDAFSSVF